MAVLNTIRSTCAPFAALSALLLTSCAVGPDFHQPEIKTSQNWHQSLPAEAARGIDQDSDVEWWKIYNDPKLTRLIAEVTQSNLELRTASARFAQSMAERRIASAAQMPTLETNASYARERASPNGVLGLLGTMEDQGAGEIASGKQGFGPARMAGASGSSAFNLPQYGMNASWEVDLWGHVRRQVEAATSAMRATEDMRRGVFVSLMAETAQDYLSLREVQAQITNVQQNIETAQHAVHLTTLRFSNGAATRLDVANSTGQLHNFEAQLPVLRDQEVHLINALSFLVAREPGALKGELGFEASIPAIPSAIPVGLPSELASRRPDIRVAEDRLHVATANIGVAIADFFPRVTLSGSLDVQALEFSGLGSWASRQYGFGPTVTFPIFEGGRLTGQLRLRKAQQREAAIDLQKTVLMAWQDVDDTMADVSAMQSQRDRLQQAVEQAQIALNTAQAQYAQGASDFLNVLSAQNVLLNTKSLLIQATANVSISVAKLYRALGGGWEKSFPDK